MKLLQFITKKRITKAASLSKLNQQQLAKVIGGTDSTETTSVTQETPSRSYGPGQAHWGSAK